MRRGLIPAASGAHPKEFYEKLNKDFVANLDELKALDANPNNPAGNGNNDPMEIVGSTSTLSFLASSSKKRFAAAVDLGTNKRLHTCSSSSTITKVTEAISSYCCQREREKHQISPSLAPADDLKTYTHQASYTVSHGSRIGILALDISYAKDIIAIADHQANISIFCRSSERIVRMYNNHIMMVNSVKFSTGGDFIVSGSSDMTVRVWKVSSRWDYECVNAFWNHTEEVTAVAIEATNSLFVTASLDSTWCIYDFNSDKCRAKVASPESNGYTSAAFHPSGRIFGTGSSDAVVKIWDANTQENIGKLGGHVGPVTALSFSENGYQLATAARDGFKLWDLRYSNCSLKDLNPYDPIWDHKAVEFDYSGRYLAIASSSIGIYDVATDISNPITKISYLPGTGPATCMKFGPDARYIAFGTSDQDLRILGPPYEGKGDVNIRTFL